MKTITITNLEYEILLIILEITARSVSRLRKPKNDRIDEYAKFLIESIKENTKA